MPRLGVHAGNLLVMRDGRVAFLDFGIVGSISPTTWQALQALMESSSTADYSTMAKAMATLGVTKQAVDVEVRTTENDSRADLRICARPKVHAESVHKACIMSAFRVSSCEGCGEVKTILQCMTHTADLHRRNTIHAAIEAAVEAHVHVR